MTIDLPAQQKVGHKRAGLACLPNGVLRTQDFFHAPRDLTLALEQALPDRVEDHAPGLVVSLKAIDARLCARSWGLGDRQTLSGSSIFVFEWSLGGAPLRTEEIAIEARRGDGMTIETLTQQAVERLSARIAAKTAAR